VAGRRSPGPGGRDRAWSIGADGHELVGWVRTTVLPDQVVGDDIGVGVVAALAGFTVNSDRRFMEHLEPVAPSLPHLLLGRSAVPIGPPGSPGFHPDQAASSAAITSSEVPVKIGGHSR